MTGFEHQVASHMIWEGDDLVEKGLAVERMIHDRYQAARRNPWNEDLVPRCFQWNGGRG